MKEIKIGERYEVRGEIVERAQDDDPRVRRFRASTPDKDRHRTRIMPEGIDTKNFMKNPIFLWAHDGYGGWETPKMEHVLGRIIEFAQDKKFLDIDVKFLDASVNPLAEMALGMLNARALNAVSIGFIPKEIKIEKDSDGSDRDVPVITKSELLEVSLVPIPSNLNALTIARSMVASDLRDHPDALNWLKELRLVGIPTKNADATMTGVMDRAHTGGWPDPNAPVVGDRIRVVTEPHDPSHEEGIVRQVVEMALGVEFDSAPDEIHRWYIPSEVMVVGRADDMLEERGATTFGDLPLADRERAWDAAAAVTRVKKWASDGGSGERDDMDWIKYRRAFFWFDGENIEAFGSYKLPFADIINGRLTAVPRGIFAGAQRLEGTNIPDRDKERVQTHMGKYYEKMREEFEDEDIIPPWERVAAPPASAADSGVDEKAAKAIRQTVDEYTARKAFERVIS